MKVFKRLTPALALSLFLWFHSCAAWDWGAIAAQVAGGSGQVAISGSAPSRSNISVVITAQEGGKRCYLGQIRSDASGNFAVSIPLDGGTYTAMLGSAEGSLTLPSFTVTAAPGNGGGGGNPTVSTYAVTISVTSDAGRGVILPATVKSYQNNTRLTALDVLCQVLEQAGIDYDIRGGYVAAIGGLKERDRGPLSGWMFRVNGIFPRIGPADYRVRDNDVIEFVYTLDGGRDVGNVYETTELTEISDQALAGAQARLSQYEAALSQLGSETIIKGIESPMNINQAMRLKEDLEANWVSVALEIGTAGGILTDESNEVILNVPPGAVSGNEILTVNEVDDGDSESEGLMIRTASGIFEFGPPGMRFHKPVTICLRFAPAELSLKDLVPAWFDQDREEWVPLPGIIDVANGVAVFQTDHFTRFAVIQVSGSSESDVPAPFRFAEDLQGYEWASPAVIALVEQGVLHGSPRGLELGRPVTRAEFTSLLVRAAGIPAPAGQVPGYQDVKPSDWFGPTVAAASARNVVKGYNDGTFRPHQPVTRYECAVMLAQAGSCSDNSSGAVFSDFDRAPSWARPGMNYVGGTGIMAGYPDRSFKGERLMTRAEAAVVIYNYMSHSGVNE